MARQGRTFVCGVAAGAMMVCAIGAAMQPANEKAEAVIARLDRLERALLKPHSTLPDDPEKSIESMLETLLERSEDMHQRLSTLDPDMLDALAQRVHTIGTELLNVEAARLVRLDDRLTDVERQFEVLGPVGRLSDLVRRVDALERELRTNVSQRATGNERDIEAVERHVERLEREVRRLERKIG